MIALRNAKGVLSHDLPLVQEHQTILIEGNRIIAMGETDSLEIPERLTPWIWKVAWSCLD